MSAFETLSQTDRQTAIEVGSSMAGTLSDFDQSEATEAVATGLVAWRAYDGEDHHRFVISEAVVGSHRLHEYVADALVDRIEQSWALRADSEWRAS